MMLAELHTYLADPTLPRQVLLTFWPTRGASKALVRTLAGAPPWLRAPLRTLLRVAYRIEAARGRAALLALLREVQARDDRVRFTPLGALNQIAVVATRDVILDLLEQPAVAAIIPDAPRDLAKWTRAHPGEQLDGVPFPSVSSLLQEFGDHA